jgi:hypothetical protein
LKPFEFFHECQALRLGSSRQLQFFRETCIKSGFLLPDIFEEWLKYSKPLVNNRTSDTKHLKTSIIPSRHIIIIIIIIIITVIMKSATVLATLGAGAFVSAQSPVTEIPAPAGTELSAEPIVVTGSFDGEGFLYDRDGKAKPRPPPKKKILSTLRRSVCC